MLISGKIYVMILLWVSGMLSCGIHVSVSIAENVMNGTEGDERKSFV